MVKHLQVSNYLHHEESGSEDIFLHLQAWWLVLSSLTLLCLVTVCWYRISSPLLLFHLLHFPLFNLNGLLVVTGGITTLYCSLTLNSPKMLTSKLLMPEQLESCSFLALSLVQIPKEYSPHSNVSTKQFLHTATYIYTKLTLIVQNVSVWKGHLRGND